MKLIPLSQGQFAMVDDADFDSVNQFNWSASKSDSKFYAVRTIRKPDGKKTTQLMHQFLMPGVKRVDHEDGNRCNNQRKNIRPATVQQNAQGFQKKRSGTYSRFRGVTWHKRFNRWQAQLECNGKTVYLGRFTDETEAAHAYDSAAVFYFGDFASTNFDIGQITITSL